MNMLRSFYHTVLAWTGSIRYRRPSRRLFVVGVTGTKGKSTVIELMNVIFEAAGERTALLSTVRQKIGTETEPNEWSNTMPGRWRLQRFLHRAATERCTYAFVEVTSQGTTQHRHRFIDWDVAVFLNLHPEHIEAHGSFEKYREAKLNFFRSLKHSKKSRQYFLINRDDQDSMLFYEVAKRVRSGEVIWFSKNDVFKMVEGLRATYHQEWLRADFNVENVYAVVLWVIKNANKYINEQLIEMFKDLSEPECVKNYKSNLKTWEKNGWRYQKNHTKYTLEYRIITQKYTAIKKKDSWGYEYTNNLSKNCHIFINDVLTIANNLGFVTQGTSFDRYWESNNKVMFYTAGGKELVEVKAFMNGNLHFKFNQEFIKALNVEASRLLGWIRSPQEAVNEMELDVDFVKSHFETNALFGIKDGQKLLEGH
ncbi:hypothetical protein LCGC14_0579570 [marine sediment metagenome]|uniref:Mur ligase central domain-containing protein n=1 Tax=marine sediment metagenome TaxID=412755 RepID=A0A0F9RGM0_9ZZZZ